MEFMASYIPSADAQTLYAEYLRILDHMWDISLREGRPVTFEEGAMDYALAQADLSPDQG
jgi:hypothetical protein